MLVREIVPVLVAEPALFRRLHQNFTTVNVPERKERVHRDVLKALDVVPSLVDPRHRRLSEIGGVSPIRDVVQVVGPAARGIRLVFSEYGGGWGGLIRIAGPVRRVNHGIAAGAMETVG